MKTELWHNVIHSHKVADHMNLLWGDYGRFDVPSDGIIRLTHEDDTDLRDVKTYIMGYVAGLDEILEDAGEEDDWIDNEPTYLDEPLFVDFDED